MPDKKSRRRGEIIPADSKGLVPIQDLGKTPILKIMGLSERFPQKMRELNDVMAAPKMGSEIGSVDLTVFPDSDFPVVEQRVNPAGMLHLRVRLIPSSRKVRIRVSWQSADAGDEYQSRDYSPPVPVGYWLRLTDLKAFVQRVFPGKKCMVKGKPLNPTEEKPVSGEWDFLRIRISTLERFYWRCSTRKFSLEALRSSGMIVSWAEWVVEVEGQSNPIFVFQLIRPYPWYNGPSKRETFLAVPLLFWEGPSSDAEAVLEAFKELIGKCLVLGKEGK